MRCVDSFSRCLNKDWCDLGWIGRSVQVVFRLCRINVEVVLLIFIWDVSPFITVDEVCSGCITVNSVECQSTALVGKVIDAVFNSGELRCAHLIFSSITFSYSEAWIGITGENDRLEECFNTRILESDGEGKRAHSETLMCTGIFCDAESGFHSDCVSASAHCQLVICVDIYWTCFTCDIVVFSACYPFEALRNYKTLTTSFGRVDSPSVCISYLAEIDIRLCVP